MRSVVCTTSPYLTFRWNAGNTAETLGRPSGLSSKGGYGTQWETGKTNGVVVCLPLSSKPYGRQTNSLACAAKVLVFQSATEQRANALLERMVEKGSGRWEPLRTGPKGGRPTRLFIPHEGSGDVDGSPLNGVKRGEGNGREQALVGFWKPQAEEKP